MRDGSVRRRAVAYGLFALYLAFVFTVTGVPACNTLTFDPALQLFPVAGLREDWKNALLNVLLFVPLGVLLPLFWPRLRRWSRTAGCGFGLSLGIEVSQLFTFRTTDVNDLLTNTAGVLLGYALVKGGRCWDAVPVHGPARDAAMLAGAAFLSNFFLQPVLSDFLWSLVCS